MKFESFIPHTTNENMPENSNNNPDEFSQKSVEQGEESAEKKIWKSLSEIAKDGYQYRAIGADGFRDIQETGVIRPNQSPRPRITEGDLAIKAKHHDAPFFIDGAYISVIEKYNPEYVVEYPSNIDGISFARPSAGGHFGNTPWRDGGRMYELPADKAIIYKKTPEGYEKIEL